MAGATGCSSLFTDIPVFILSSCLVNVTPQADMAHGSECNWSSKVLSEKAADEVYPA